MLHHKMAAADNDEEPNPFPNYPTESAAQDANGEISGKSLLDLAPEIRNNIYQHVIDDGPSASITSTGKIAIKSPMLLVNKQVNHEFTSLTRATTPVIEAEVMDFNFDIVVSFFDGLSEIDARSLSKGAKSARKISIVLGWSLNDFLTETLQVKSLSDALDAMIGPVDRVRDWIIKVAETRPDIDIEYKRNDKELPDEVSLYYIHSFLAGSHAYLSDSELKRAAAECAAIGECFAPKSS